MINSPLPIGFEERVRNLRELIPHLSAEVRFYRGSEGGRKVPVPNSFGCPCALSLDSDSFNDARILFDRDWIELGETVTGQFFFLYGEEVAEKYRNAGRFYLWEGRIIAEATVV